MCSVSGSIQKGDGDRSSNSCSVGGGGEGVSRISMASQSLPSPFLSFLLPCFLSFFNPFLQISLIFGMFGCLIILIQY